MTKHTPQIRLQAAQRQYTASCEACPHWDFEVDANDDPYDCCYEVMEATKELRLAKKAMTNV